MRLARTYLGFCFRLEIVEVRPVVGEEGLVQNAVPLPNLTHSAKNYAGMVKAGMPYMPVHTGAERRKFSNELSSQLYVPGDPRGRQQNFQSINFDKWTNEWNKYCAQIESREVDFERVYRKTSAQLKAYYEKYRENANARVTMMPIRAQHASLASQLQQGEQGAVFEGMVGSVAPPPIPRSSAGAGSGGGAAGVAGDADGDVDMMDVGGGGDDGSCEVGGGDDGFGGGGVGDGEESQRPAKKPRGPSRGPQICITCGHRKQEGGYRKLHKHPRDKKWEGPICKVDTRLHNKPGSDGDKGGRVRKGVQSWPRCDCATCTAVA